MDYVKIKGGIPLYGEVKIQGSKNSALPILAASILCREAIIRNCPRIEDVNIMIHILRSLGMKCEWNEDELRITQNEEIISFGQIDNYNKLRASVLFAGALTGKTKRAYIPYPGGCTIGARPIDIHIRALKSLGAVIEEKKDGIYINGDNLHASTVIMDFPSVGATENILLLASQICGETRIINCAIEPEIDELICFLNKAGAVIKRNKSEISIMGSKLDKKVEHYIVPDRIVAGTYALAVMGTGGEICLKHAPIGQMHSVLEIIKAMGGDWHLKDDNIIIKSDFNISPLPYIQTRPYPYFPTDLQSQLVAVLTKADGISTIEETIFEDRFKTVYELQRMQADIVVKDNRAVIHGLCKMKGAKVTSTDLRGCAALMIAGMMADGETTVTNLHYAKRGYCDICSDLKNLGADILYG